MEVSEVLCLDQDLNDWPHITKYVWVFVIGFYLSLGSTVCYDIVGIVLAVFHFQFVIQYLVSDRFQSNCLTL